MCSICEGMKREFAMLMKSHLEEIGELPSGGRRMTRSQNVVSPSKDNEGCVRKVGDKVKGGESKRTKKDVDEGKLETVGTNMEVEVSTAEVEPINTEEVGIDLGEDLGQSSCTESPSPLVGVNDLDFGGENGKRATDSGCERIEEAANKLPEKPKRFTRSTLREQDIEIEMEVGVEKVESGGKLASTSSPSKLEMKMSKKVGLAKLPIKLKDLLQTGLLEGLNVRYVRGTKVKYFTVTHANAMHLLLILLLILYSTFSFSSRGLGQSLNSREYFGELGFYVHVVNAREKR